MGTWKQWLQSLKAPWSNRNLAAAVEFVLRAVEARRLLDVVPSEETAIAALAWPSTLSQDDRVAWRDRIPALPIQTMVRAWLNTATRVLDDNKVPAPDNWTDFKLTVDGVRDLTARAAQPPPKPPIPPVPNPTPNPTRPTLPENWKPIGPYGRIVYDWQPPYWTRLAAAEALRWLELQSTRAKLPTDVTYYYTIIVDGGPDTPVPAAVAAQLSKAYRVLANDLDLAVDDGKLTAQGYTQPDDAWTRAQAAARAAEGDDETPDVEPGVTTRDLPPKPPAPGGASPPRPSGGAPPVAGPYVSAFNRFRTWATGANGLDTDGASPRMSREQSAAVLRYIVRQARTHLHADDPATKRWLPIALAILGWRQRGDTYRTDAAWRTGNTGVPTIVEVWSYALDVCRQLDAQGVPFDGPHPQPTIDYGVMADEAAAAQREDDPAMPSPVPQPAGGTAQPGTAQPNGGVFPIPPLPITPPSSPSRPPGGGGGDIGLVLLALLAMEAI